MRSISGLDLIAIALLAVLLLTGCNSSSGGSSSSGGGGGSGSDDSAAEPPDIPDTAFVRSALDLSDAKLSSGEAEPFELVRINGLPDGASAEDLWVEYRMASDGWPIGPGVDDSAIGVILQQYNSSSLYLLAPVVALDGAAIKLRITDGASYSATETLTVSALPAAATGSLEQLLDLTSDLVKAVSEAYGLDYPADLRSRVNNPASIEPYLLPLVSGYHALDNPDNANSLRTLDLDDDAVEAIERVIAHMDLTGELASWLADVNEEDNLIADSVQALLGHVITIDGPVSSNTLPRNSVQPRLFSDSSVGLTMESPIPIGGPEELAHYLYQHGEIRRRQDDVEAAVQLAGLGLVAIGVGAAFVTTGPGGVAAAGSAPTVLATVSTGAMALGIFDVAYGAYSLTRGTYPCCITGIDMTLSPESGRVAVEDASDPSLELINVRGTARGERIDLTQEILNRVVNKVGGFGVSNAMKRMDGNNAMREQLTSAGANETLQLPDSFVGLSVAFHWSNIDMIGDDADKWLGVRHQGFGGLPTLFTRLPGSDSGIPFQLSTDGFFGNETSLDVLTIEPSRDQYRMGHWHPPVPADVAELSAEHIRIRFEPAGLRVDDADESYPFKVHVEHAEDFEIWSPLDTDPETLGIVLLSGPDPQGVYHYQYTPEGNELPPATIAVSTRPMTTGGVRGRGDPPERRGSMLITPDPVQLAVSPRTACLEAGETQQLSAKDPLLEIPVDVTWSADRGSVSSSGLYTAPGGDPAGYARITATAVEDDSVTVTTELKLGCSCWWSASVGGGYGHSNSYWSMVLTLDEDESIVGIQTTPKEGSNFLGALLTMRDPIPPGATGTFNASGNGSLQGPISVGNTWANHAGMPFTPLTVQVSRHELLEGPGDNARALVLTVNGMVGVGEPDGNIKIGNLRLELDGVRWFGIDTAGTTRLLRCTPPGPL